MSISTYLAHAIVTIIVFIIVSLVTYVLTAPIRYRYTSWDPQMTWILRDRYGVRVENPTSRKLAIKAGELIYGIIGSILLIIAIGYLSYTVQALFF